MKAYFEFLDQLLASGVLTDQFGAPAYLQREFGLTEQDACQVFDVWAKTFSETKTVEQRIVGAGYVLDADDDDAL